MFPNNWPIAEVNNIPISPLWSLHSIYRQWNISVYSRSRYTTKTTCLKILEVMRISFWFLWMAHVGGLAWWGIIEILQTWSWDLVSYNLWFCWQLWICSWRQRGTFAVLWNWSMSLSDGNKQKRRRGRDLSKEKVVVLGNRIWWNIYAIRMRQNV